MDIEKLTYEELLAHFDVGETLLKQYSDEQELFSAIQNQIQITLDQIELLDNQILNDLCENN